jgi:hypothetical protein
VQETSQGRDTSVSPKPPRFFAVRAPGGAAPGDEDSQVHMHGAVKSASSTTLDTVKLKPLKAVHVPRGTLCAPVGYRFSLRSCVSVDRSTRSTNAPAVPPLLSVAPLKPYSYATSLLQITTALVVAQAWRRSTTEASQLAQQLQRLLLTIARGC